VLRNRGSMEGGGAKPWILQPKAREMRGHTDAARDDDNVVAARRKVKIGAAHAIITCSLGFAPSAFCRGKTPLVRRTTWKRFQARFSWLTS